MPRIKKRKVPACVTCLIVMLVICVVFTVGVVIAANVVFNNTVSPLIGGVKLNECISLLSGALHSNKDLIVTETYTQDDLNSFYFQLNNALYQADMTDEEYSTRYDALSEKEKAEYGSLEAYKEAHPYRIDLEVIDQTLNLGDLIGGGENNNENMGESELSAAGEDGEENTENETLEALFKELSFNFQNLGLYPYKDSEDYSYTTFQIHDKQVAALIGDILSLVFKYVDLGQTVPQLDGVDLSAYAGVPQVVFSDVASEGENSKTKLYITIELKLKDLVNDAVTPILIEQGIPEFAVNAVKSILPKDFFVSLETFPTDENEEVTLYINNYDNKQTDDLKKIVNALLVDVVLFPEEGGEGSIESEPTEPTNHGSVFSQVNTKVVDIFSKINDFIPIEFVADEDNNMTLRLSHIQGLLQLAGLFDVNDIENSITPHEFMTTLRCLIDEASASNYGETANIQVLYTQIEEKYGINASYWESNNLFDTETLTNITSEIHLDNVDFKENSDMKVKITDRELTKLISDAVKDGLFNQTDESLALAEDDTTSILDSIDFDSIYIVSNSPAVFFEEDDKYIREDGDVTIIVDKGRYHIDQIYATVRVDLAKLLLSESEESSSAMMESLSKSLPKGLSFTLIINVKEVYNDSNELKDRVVGIEAGKTTVRINKFDDEYSDIVIKIIEKMVTKLSPSEEGEASAEFDINSLFTPVEEAFSNVLNIMKDTLNCDILLQGKPLDRYNKPQEDKGYLLLPSVYELISGASSKNASNEADILTIDQSRELLIQVYDTDIAIVDDEGYDSSKTYDYELNRFKVGSADEFLSNLSSKYYMNTTLTVDSIINGNIDISADSINFKGENGLYSDTTDIKELDVALTNDALADLIKQSGKLDFLSTTGEGSSSNDLISSLSIINATYEWDSGLFINFDFEVELNKSLLSSGEGLSMENLIPSKAYLTAKTLVFINPTSNPQGYNLYHTDVLLNKQSIDNLCKLIRSFADPDFNQSELTSTVEDAMGEVFDTIKENINLDFVRSISDDFYKESIRFKNVFNTINKLSHKNDASYKSDNEDDKALRLRLQEFARQPEYTTNSDDIVSSVSDLNKFEASLVYTNADADEFFKAINDNYYISAGNEINKDSLSSMNSVGSDLIDFKKIYTDSRTIEEMQIELTSKRFASLANQLVGNISLDSGSSVSPAGESSSSDIGASIVQTKISVNDIGKATLRILLLVKLNSSDETLKNILADHFFITADIDLSADEFGYKAYKSILYINNMSEEETNDLFNRIKLLEDAFETSFGFDIDSVKTSLSDNIKDVFDNNMNMFGELNIKDGYIDIPNVFEYITGGSIEGTTYNPDKPMFEVSPLSSTKGLYGINENGKAGYFDGASFIVLGNAVKKDDIWGYYDGDVFVNIQTLPEQLMYDLRVFGNMPNESKNTITVGDSLGYEIYDYDSIEKTINNTATEDITVYGEIGIHLQNAEDGFYHWNGSYYYDDQAHFFDMLNTNYYITNESNKITAKKIIDNEVITLNNELFDFKKLYTDQRNWNNTLIKVKGNTFAALANEFYEGGIKITENDIAEIVQMRIFTKDKAENNDDLISDGEGNKYTTLRTIIRVSLTDASSILPEYLYMVVYTIIDPTAPDSIRFDSDFIINDFGYKYVDTYKGLQGQISSTQSFIDRLNTIKASFGMEFDFDLDSIKDTIKTTFQDIFEKDLQAFGKLEYIEDSIVIPNIFQYMAGGQLVREGSSTDLVYKNDAEYHMKEADGITETDPEVLRNRFKELGNGEAYTGQSIAVWNSSGVYYNDNIYSSEDLESFYEDIQAYYFLSKKPTASSFTIGSSYFNDLTGTNFNSTFNLNGLSSSLDSSDPKYGYITKGLYKYAGEQIAPKLSDKAMAGLLNDQSAITIDGGMNVNSINITSIKIIYQDSKHMTIEITTKISTKQDGSKNPLPEVFYMTTITERVVNGASVSYDTDVAINAFTPNDLTNFIANINHIELASQTGFTENLTTDEISESVENALREMLDGKLADYTDGFGTYSSQDDGFGYIQFPNIYDKIYQTTGSTVGNSKTMQNVIVKLNNKNEYLDKNAYNYTTTAPSFGDSFITDKQFGMGLQALFTGDDSYIKVEQVVIFKDTNSGYNGYEQLIKNIDQSFAFAEDNGYFFITVSINSSLLNCNMSIAPEKIYISVLMDSDGNLVKKAGTTTTIKFMQDFDQSEMNMFMSIFSDDNNKLDFDSKIESKSKTLMMFVSGSKELNQHTDFSEYYGYIGTK